MPGFVGASVAAFKRGEAAASHLEASIALIPGAGVLGVRVVPVSGSPLVRTELLSPHAKVLTEFLRRWLARVETGEVPPLPGERWSGARRRRRTDDIDLSAMNPVWYAHVPGVDYGAGYECAYEVLAGLEEVISCVVLGGLLAMDPACTQEGAGAARFDLTPNDAERLATLLDYAASV
jgi:hypothetical protein